MEREQLQRECSCDVDRAGIKDETRSRAREIMRTGGESGEDMRRRMEKWRGDKRVKDGGKSRQQTADSRQQRSTRDRRTTKTWLETERTLKLCEQESLYT